MAVRIVRVDQSTSNIPIGAFPVVMKLFLDHIDHNVVADKSALIHNFLRFSAEGSLFGDLGSEHITSSLPMDFSFMILGPFADC